MSSYPVLVTLQFERSDRIQEATATVLDRSVANRAGRAAGALALCLFFAFLGVFIPLMHFILPVTLLVIGVVLGVMRLRETSSILEVRGTCFGCKAERVIPTSGRFRDGRTLRCNQCAERFTIHMRPAASSS